MVAAKKKKPVAKKPANNKKKPVEIATAGNGFKMTKKKPKSKKA